MPSDQLLADLADIKTKKLSASMTLQQQIIAAYREWARSIKATGSPCPCCGHKPRKKKA
jgi:hypothetical protein